MQQKYKYQIFVPYRVCLLGAHTDHQLGKILGVTLDKGITMDYNKTTDGAVCVISPDFKGEANFTYNNIPKYKTNNWEDYLIGSIKTLQENYTLKYGINAYIHKSIPIGGLASSSAIIITYLLAISKVNNIKLTKEEIVSLVVKVEHQYLNNKVGLLDPSCEVYCKKNNFLYLDIKENIRKNIKINSNLNFKICLIYSGVTRRLSNTIYNVRVDECKNTALILNNTLRNEPIEFNNAYLGNFTYQEFYQNKSLFSNNQIKRAEHFYSEIERVEEGIKSIENNDIHNLGKLIFSSGTSSIINYETGSNQLSTLHEIAKKTKGIYGGRFSGAGFNGYYMAIIDPQYENQIKEEISKKYLNIYPELKNKFQIYFCECNGNIKI